MNSNTDPFPSSPHYCAYMVRIWRENTNASWRASAQSVRTGEKIYFADLEHLFDFLRRQTTDDHFI